MSKTVRPAHQYIALFCNAVWFGSKGYSLPPEFPSDGEYYDGQQLGRRRPVQGGMSSSFVQINTSRPQPAIPLDPPSPTAMTLNSQYENMSTGSSKGGAVYEPLELKTVAGASRGASTSRAKGQDIMQRSADYQNAPKKSAHTPIRQKYKGFAQTLRMRQNKNKKEAELRKSAPIQPPRISSLIKENKAQAPAPAKPPTATAAKDGTRSRRSSKSAPSRRVVTPPPSPPPEVVDMTSSTQTQKSSPTYSVPMRNSVMMPDVVYQTTEASFSSRADEENYEVPVSQRDAASSASSAASASGGSGGSAAYTSVHYSNSNAPSTYQASEDGLEDLESVYSCTQAVDAVTNSPVNKAIIHKPVISLTGKHDMTNDPDAKAVTGLDLSKPIVVPSVIQLDIDSEPTGSKSAATAKTAPDSGVYANIGPRSKRTSALLNSSDYGALCDHSSNAKAPSVVDEDEDVYASAQQYYVKK